eukprot:4824906-Amphidinium_carterae.1
MEEAKNKKVAINDASYIDHRLQSHYMNKDSDKKMQRRCELMNYNDFYVQLTQYTSTNHETDLEQSNTTTKRVHPTISELARRDLQLRDNSADGDSYIDENGITHAVHSGRHQITSTTYRELVDNNNAGGIHGLKGKWYKGKVKDKKGKGDYNQQKGKGYPSDYQPYHNGKGKLGKYGSRPYNSKGKATKVTTTTIDPKDATITAEEKAKGKDQKGNHPTTTFHHHHHRTKEKDQQKEKEKN